MPKRPAPAIPEPTTTIVGLQASVLALKEAVEILQGQRGSPGNRAVDWDDLTELGLIGKEQKPKK